MKFLLSGRAWVLILFVCVSAPGWAGTHVLTGRIRQGESYHEKINDRLMFKLVPNSVGNPPGWVITVAPTDLSREDYVWVVTPPYRFWNPRYVDVSYGVSAKEAVGNSPRDFFYVTNEDDFKKAEQAVDILLWPYNYSEKEVSQAREDLDAVRKSSGVFAITDSRITRDADGKEMIAELSFSVELNDNPVNAK
jgi:hypothetical protein